MATNNATNTSNPITVGQGGTGDASLTAFAVLCGGTTSTSAVQSIAGLGSSGQILTSNGAGALPTFQPVSSSGGTIVTQFTASGTFTKNASTKWVRVVVFGAGSGGGSGRKGTSGASGGGGGGAAGSLAFIDLPASIITGSVTVTIGGTAAGGIAISASSTNGNIGGSSNVTSFGLYATYVAPGGTGGTTTSAAGASSTGTSSWGNTAIWFANPGGIGSNTVGNTPSNPTAQFAIGARGGGGGAGGDTTTERAGGAGGDVVDLGATIILAGGAGGTESGTITGGNGTSYTSISAFFQGGAGGGGGGGTKTTINGGTGGNGGTPSGGAGGGGGGINAVSNSGAGGIGARGEIWVIEHT